MPAIHRRRKTALTGRSKISRVPYAFPVVSVARGLCACSRHQPGAFCGSQSTAAFGHVPSPPE